MRLPKLHLRFSLRILLLFTLLIGLVLVPFCIKLDRARKQKELVEDIRRRGGMIVYSEQHNVEETLLRRCLGKDSFDEVIELTAVPYDEVEIDPTTFTFEPAPDTNPMYGFDFQRLSILDQLVRVDVSDTPFDTLNSISNLKKLTELHLSGTKIGHINGIGRHGKLRLLSLYATKVRDISPLSDLPELTLLDIADTSVTSIEPLRHCTRLKGLAMSGLQIDDLSPLLELGSLKYLVLSPQQQYRNKRTVSILRKSNPEILIRPEYTPPSDVQ